MPSYPSQERQLYEAFAPAVGYIVVRRCDGSETMGSCFHIGDGVFITARHVVEGNTIEKIVTTFTGTTTLGGGYGGTYMAGAWQMVAPPVYHPTAEYDIAALRLERSDRSGAPSIPLHPVGDKEWAARLLHTVVVMGYPPIPGSRSPVLVCAKAEVNASFETYFDHQRVVIVSCLARGGFSGAPALTPPHHCLGLVTRAVTTESRPEELGFMAVLPALQILEMLDHHGITPLWMKE